MKLRTQLSALSLPALVLACFALSACGTLSVNVADPLIESPEMAGETGAFEFGFGAEGSTRYTYTDDASRRPPTLSEADVNKSGTMLFARGGYSVTEWLEFSLRVIPGEWANFLVGGLGLTTRAQILGVGESTGWKLAAFGGLIGTTATTNGDQNGKFGDGGHNWKAKASAQTLTAGTSLGYRFEDPDILVYTAISYADQRVSGSIDHELSQNGLSPAASYGLPEVRANARALALGTRLGSANGRAEFGVEARLVNRNWPETSAPEVRGGGASTEATYMASLYFH